MLYFLSNIDLLDCDVMLERVLDFQKNIDVSNRDTSEDIDAYFRYIA
jgi:hypothetical protein